MTPLYAIRTARTRDLEALMTICLSWDKAPAKRDPALLRELLTQALGDDDSTIYLALRGHETVGFAGEPRLKSCTAYPASTSKVLCSRRWSRSAATGAM